MLFSTHPAVPGELHDVVVLVFLLIVSNSLNSVDSAVDFSSIPAALNSIPSHPTEITQNAKNYQIRQIRSELRNITKYHQMSTKEDSIYSPVLIYTYEVA